VVLGAVAHELVAQTEDVSFAGIHVRADTLLPERELVRLRLKLLPEGDELAATGMVVRHTPAGEGLPPGMGIQFYALGHPQRDRWNRFIRFVARGRTDPRPSSQLPVADLVQVGDRGESEPPGERAMVAAAPSPD